MFNTLRYIYFVSGGRLRSRVVMSARVQFGHVEDLKK